MRLGCFLTAVLLIAVSLWAGDPWKEKSYKDWDEKDIHRILTDSPWSKRVAAEEKEHANLEAPQGAPTVSGAPGAEEEDEDEEKGRDRDEKDERREKLESVFMVRWVSSRTLRQAAARGRVLQGQTAATDIERVVAPAPPDYELALVGSNMVAFQDAKEATLQRNTHLLTKMNKRDIACTAVELVHSANGSRINAVVFHFPRVTASGTPTISGDERELKFVTRNGANEIKARFDPRQMVDARGSDL
jgi:hypothetical protein